MAAKVASPSLVTDVSSLWLWYRNGVDGRPRAREEFEDLPADARAKLAVTIARHLKGESRAKDVDHLGSGLYEIRVRHLNNQYRVLFIGWGPHRVGLTAFMKNQQATPKVFKQRAAKRAAQWLDDFGQTPEAH